MKVCSFGSLNIDYVYRVRRFVEAGETISSLERSVVCGGKGLNQSIALARCGAKVFHAGNVGAADGSMLLSALQSNGVDISHVCQQNAVSGHAIIQVDDGGENSILLHGGTNLMVSREQIEDVIGCFDAGDFIVLQNEVNLLPEIIRAAHERGMKVVLNPSPVAGILETVPLEMVDYLFVNAAEACQLARGADAEQSARVLREKYPNMTVVCTLGANGAMVFDGALTRVGGRRAHVVDTTGAGDTFLGYFVGLMVENKGIPECLEGAIAAATLCVEKAGASTSIPYRSQVETLCMGRAV